MRFLFLVFVLALAALARAPLTGQEEAPLARAFAQERVVAPAANVVVPQARSMRMDDDVRGVALTRVDALVRIDGRVATTALVVVLKNHDDRAQEAELLVPVPDGAVVRSFDFQGTGRERTARLLPADEARFTYRSIVDEVQDPALLEFVGHRLVRSSVFPVPAQGEQRVTLVFEHVLEQHGSRFEYVLPRSESHVSAQIPWNVWMVVEAEGPLATVHSPTHVMKVERLGDRHATLELSGENAREPGPVRVAFVLESGGLSGAFWAHPDERFGGGTFMLLAGLPPIVDEAARARVEREVVLVLDRSGSMDGPKFEQVQRAAKQVLGSLRAEERFAIVDYAGDVTTFQPQPVAASIENLLAADRYIDTLRTGGGTNIDGALAAALALEHTSGTLPLVLFLTDGQATEGEKKELAIRANVAAANTAQRRLFTFGVGHDVNAPLLDGLAATTGAQSCYVAPDEDVETAVASLVERLRGPVFADGVLRVLDAHGAERPELVRYLVPSAARDLYAGDQVTVLGTYRTSEPFTLELAGLFLGEPHTFRFDFDPARDGDSSNAFVSRLWASRRIGELTEFIRQAGADPSVANDEGVFAARPDLAEYVDSIVDLSIEYGILSEFTAFFAQQGTDLSNRTSVAASVGGNLLRDMLRIRVGKAAVGRSEAVRAEMYRTTLNRLGRATGGAKKSAPGAAAPMTVQQIGDRAFYLRSGVWVDSRIVRRGTALTVDEYVELDSPRHHEIVARLVGEGRAALLSLRGVVVVEIDGRAVRLPIGTPYGTSPSPAAAPSSAAGAAD